MVLLHTHTEYFRAHLLHIYELQVLKGCFGFLQKYKLPSKNFIATLKSFEFC